MVGVSGLNLIPIDKQAPCYTVSFGIDKLIKYPIECLEHIIVHEMTHLLEINHTPRFYSLLETYYPTYKENDKVNQILIQEREKISSEQNDEN